MLEKNVDKHYISSIDKFLEDLRKKSISPSQLKESLIYKNIIKQRDNPEIVNPL